MDTAVIEFQKMAVAVKSALVSARKRQLEKELAEPFRGSYLKLTTAKNLHKKGFLEDDGINLTQKGIALITAVDRITKGIRMADYVPRVKELEAPNTRYSGIGKFIGITIDGHKFWCDTRILLKGVPPCGGLMAYNKHLSETQKDYIPDYSGFIRLMPAVFKMSEYYNFIIFEDARAIQAKYYDIIIGKYPKAEFWSKKDDCESAIILKDRGEFIGMIMPVSWEGNEKEMVVKRIAELSGKVEVKEPEVSVEEIIQTPKEGGETLVRIP